MNVGVNSNFLPQPLQTNTWTDCVLVRRSQRLESLVTDITWVNPLSLMCVVLPHCTDPIQQRHEFPHKPALDIFRSSTSLHVIYKAGPSLEGDVADDKADPSVCHQLGHLRWHLSCIIFDGRFASWTTNMCLDRLDFLEKFLQTGQGGEWKVI